MLRFVIRKMISKKWMVLALLIGNILLISITASNPMYTRAVLQRTLNTSFQDFLAERNKYPATLTIRASNSVKNNPLVAELEGVIGDVAAAYELPVREKAGYYSLNPVRVHTDLERKEMESGAVTVGTLTDMDAHVEWIYGTGMGKTPDENGILDAAVSEGAMISMGLLPGEVLTLDHYLMPNGEPMKLRIASVFSNSADDDPYWVFTPNSYDETVFLDQEIFNQIFLTGDMANGVGAVWYLMLDYTAIQVEQVPKLLALSEYYEDYFDDIPSQSYLSNFDSLLEDFQKTEVKVRTTLWVLQVPIYVLLAAFMFMVSKQMLEMEQAEIAVLKSRGAGQSQVISVYLVQSILTALLALLGGLPLSILLVKILGSANAFLEFVKRSSLSPMLDQEALMYAGIASVLSVCAMVLPVFKHSKVTIVNHKQRKHRKSDAPMWQRFFVDFLVLGLAVYGLFSFNNQKEYLAQSVMAGGALDPVLFLSSSLFMLGAGLVALRILPAIVWIIFTLFKKWWSPALYTSFLRVLRTRNQQGFIMVFLIMTIALGVFNASAARTINAHDETNLRYMAGADVTLQESWSSTSASGGFGGAGSDSPGGTATDVEYTEPDFDRYTQLPGAQSVCRVHIDANGTASVSGGNVKGVRIMGINTQEFGQTAWFDEELLPQHWYHYLNALSQRARAVLVSANFKEDYKLSIGDSITFRTSNGETTRGLIYGFVEYWPGYAQYTYTRGTDGLYTERENYLIVANLSQLQADTGLRPYQVWIKTNGDSQFVYDFIEENDLMVNSFTDTEAELVALKNDPVIQGTNGMLTVGFIVVLLLCAVGFLIYWVLSIKSRELQFGIFRAMGMSMREILTMLLNEHVFISAAAILIGAGVGLLTSKLFMPLIQIAYSSADSAVPLNVVIQGGDMIRLAVIVGIMVLVCLLVLAVLIRRMKIAQALKLGED